MRACRPSRRNRVCARKPKTPRQSRQRQRPSARNPDEWRSSASRKTKDQERKLLSFPCSFHCAPSDSAIDIDDNLLRLVGQCGGALVAHLGQLLDGALPDLVVFGFEKLLPYLKQIDAAVNFVDKLGGIVRQSKFAARNLFLSGGICPLS